MDKKISDYFKALNKKSQKAQFGRMTKEEKSAYFKALRARRTVLSTPLSESLDTQRTAR